MSILRQLAPFYQRLSSTQRFYSRIAKTTFDDNMKQVHQETLRYINPQALINIDSDIYVLVKSADPHTYPNGDAFIAELRGGPVKSSTASMEVKISDDEKHVDVVLKKLKDSTDFHCELSIPIKAGLNITTRHTVIVQNTFGDALNVKAAKCIKTNNIRAESIQLFSEGGDIHCQGILLGKETVIETNNKGSIVLDKLQGDYIKCKTSAGIISTNCSYVESSKFETDTGCLDLKNVHKNTEVYVHQEGELKMTGVHGNLNVYANKGKMNLQLSQLHGENNIKSNDMSTSVIHISDEIEKNTSVEVNLVDNSTSSITLDTTLEHLSEALHKNKQNFKYSLNHNQPSKLVVTSKNSLTLGKSSWMDTMQLQMKEKQKKQ